MADSLDVLKTAEFHNKLGISSLGDEIFASQKDSVTWN